MKIDFKDMKNRNVPQYCRKIMKTKDYPEFLEIYREDMLCFTVDVVEASKLTLVERSRGGIGYEVYKPLIRTVAENTGEFK